MPTDTTSDLIALALKLVATLGGVSVLAAALAGFAARLWADRSLEGHKAKLAQETERLKGDLARDAESHKLKLRKQELLFKRELEAASAFFALRQQFEPKRLHPEMDWGEALDDLVDNFGIAENALLEFEAKYGPVLSTENRRDVNLCIQMASGAKFAGVPGGDDAKEAQKTAERFLKVLEEIEDRFAQELRS